MITRKLIFVISVLANVNKLTGFRSVDVSGVETIFAMANENINIRCKTDMPMAYCGFIHPNGSRYSFSGSTLHAGQCAIKIKAATSDNGEWRCHIGSMGSIGEEILQYIHLRVVEELAALQKNITAVHGKPVTIACMTTKGLTPLSYCRFEPPNERPFSINSDVNVTNPILGRYYFPPNKSLDRGDCAVTIRKVKYEDVGIWTCGVGMDDSKAYIDTVSLDVEGLYTMSTASATGITFGVLGVFLAILGFVVWKKRRFLGSVPVDGDEQEMAQLRHQAVESSQRASPHVTPSPRASPQVSPTVSPHVSQRVSPHVSQRVYQHVSQRESPHVSQRVSPHFSQRISLHVTPKASPQASPSTSPQVSRKSIPQMLSGSEMEIPQIVVQSPSDKSVARD